MLFAVRAPWHGYRVACNRQSWARENLKIIFMLLIFFPSPTQHHLEILEKDCIKRCLAECVKAVSISLTEHESF